MKRAVFLSLGIAIFWVLSLWAAVPQLINFQGILRDGSGNPVANGPYSVMFKIYDAPTGGNLLWMETQSVTTSGGLFTTLLGSATTIPDTLFNDSSRYLEIKVAADPPMTPRQKLSSVGYSYVSSQWNSAGPDLFRSGNVGIGTVSSPGTRLYVYNLGSSAFSFAGVRGEADNSSTGTAYGIRGIGNSSSSGNAYGGYFSGTSSGGTSYGVYGEGGSYGGRFLGTGGGSKGVDATGGTFGVSATGGAFGGVFTGTDGGSIGVSATGSAFGGVFTGTDGTSYGVHGVGGTYGLYGLATRNVLPSYGVYGSDDGHAATTYAGYFSGSVYITSSLEVAGFIYKYGGGFKIDHPTDPANKYLYHSFVESPDMTNFYNGNITLDAKGEATVQLPDWFGVLNKDFRYQLTAIGAPGPNLYVAQEVSGNQFKIAGGTSGMKVSWQVTGIRQDAYANAHRIQVEVEKPAAERGKYLHPTELGLSETLGMHYEETQKMATEHKQMEEERVKMEQERVRLEQKTGPTKINK